MPLTILLLIGSARKNSHSKALSNAVSLALDKCGAAAVQLELVEAQLPHADPYFHRDPSQHSDQKIRDLVRQADEANAFVFISPIYHNSYSAILKNALDNLAIRQFAGKCIGLGSHGGNRSPQAVDHLRIVTRALNAISIPTQICTQDSDYSNIGEKLSLNDSVMLDRVDRFVNELLDITVKLMGKKD